MRPIRLMLLLVVFGALGAGGAAAQTDPLLDSAQPMRWRAALLPEPGDELEVPAYYGPADRARAYLNSGRYIRAIYEAVGAEDDPVELALVLGEAQLHLGRYDHAEAALEQHDDERARLLLARVALERGDLPEAASRADALLADEPDFLHARLLRGQIAEAAGDLEGARDHYRWFVDKQFLRRWQTDFDDRLFESAEDVVAIATALDRFATLEEEYRKAPALHDTIFGMFVRAYDVIDRDYWPAHLAAARFAYERGDGRLLEEELQAVFSRNERSPEALALLGQLSLDQYDFGRAGSLAMALRAINPHSREADVLDARNLLLQRQPLKAQPFADSLLQRQPDDLEALGLQAAIYAVRLEDEPLQETLARVEQIDPDNASAYYLVGRQLAHLRQYPEAEQLLRTAVERAPWWTRPRNDLGLLLTQSGDEAGAIQVLQAARELDPFNTDTSNYLALLTELAGYDVLETEHFIIQYDRSLDPLTAELAAEYLDEMKEDVARIYRWSPEEKTRIQIFPTHDRFSVRVAGDPYVGTVGASTGPVIAMVTPRDHPETLGAFDFHQVVRHEFTHTITLGRTNNRIPHWMTEGLAVREEQAPIRQEWLELLAAAYNQEELFGVGELTWGFVRPRKPTDRSLAYAQSWLVCEYLLERWGEEKLHELLDGFSRGRTEAEVFAEVLEIDLEQFDRDFLERMRQHMSEWGRLPETAQAYEQAVARGEEALRIRQYESAAEAFEEAQRLRPMDELPMRRLAGLYLLPALRDEARALEILLLLHERTTNDNRFAKRAARLLLDRGETDRARQLAWQAAQIAPYDRTAHELLRDAARAAGDEATVARQERRLEVLARVLGRE